MSSCDICSSGCKCGSGCGCDACDCCKMNPTFAEEKTTTAQTMIPVDEPAEGSVSPQTMIPGAAPVKGHMEGFEAAEGGNGGGKRKCGSNCNCDPCNCNPCSCK